MSAVFLCKAAGALLVIFSGFCISRGYGRAVADEIRAAKDAEMLVRHIGECITYRGDGIREIFGSYRGSFDGTAELWRRAAECGLSSALSSVQAPFDPETHAILTEFAASLGRGYREPQAELCRAVSAKLASHIQRLEASKKDRLRVGSAILVFVFLSLVILMI